MARMSRELRRRLAKVEAALPTPRPRPRLTPLQRRNVEAIIGLETWERATAQKPRLFLFEGEQWARWQELAETRGALPELGAPDGSPAKVIILQGETAVPEAPSCGAVTAQP
jgi:hypothetical protein